MLGREGGFGAGSDDKTRIPEFRVSCEDRGYAARPEPGRSASQSPLAVLSVKQQTFAMCLQAGFEQQLSAAEAALESHSSQGPYFLGNFGFVDLMFMPSLVRVP